MRLNDIEYHESIDEMKHADKYIERILFSKVSLICRISANLASVKMWKRCCGPI
nr:Bacterioferritin [Klebsiella pneumoniae]